MKQSQYIHDVKVWGTTAPFTVETILNDAEALPALEKTKTVVKQVLQQMLAPYQDHLSFLSITMLIGRSDLHDPLSPALELTYDMVGKPHSSLINAPKNNRDNVDSGGSCAVVRVFHGYDRPTIMDLPQVRGCVNCSTVRRVVESHAQNAKQKFVAQMFMEGATLSDVCRNIDRADYLLHTDIAAATKRVYAHPPHLGGVLARDLAMGLNKIDPSVFFRGLAPGGRQAVLSLDDRGTLGPAVTVSPRGDIVMLSNLQPGHYARYILTPHGPLPLLASDKQPGKHNTVLAHQRKWLLHNDLSKFLNAAGVSAPKGITWEDPQIHAKISRTVLQNRNQYSSSIGLDRG